MRRVFTLASGRRAKWAIVLFWVVVVVFAVSAAPKFSSAQNNDPSTYLPGDSGSAQALKQIDRLSHGQAVTEAVVVFSRRGRLNAGDLRLITADRLKLDVALPRTGVPARKLFLSADRRAAVIVFGLRVHNSTTALTHQVQEIRDVVQRTRPGLEVNVTGPAGSGFDAEQVFNEINGTLLLVTVATIFILLVLIYRSPIFWLIPLAAVGVAEVTSEGLGYLLTQIGVTVNGESAAILTVLVFGAGTDYALLLVSRYREEAAVHGFGEVAMRRTLSSAGRTIMFSAVTVAPQRTLWTE